MTETLLYYLISRSKWSKLLLLLKEIVLSASFKLGRLTDVDVEHLPELEHENLKAEITQVSGVLKTECIDKQDTWNYESRVTVSPDVLSQSVLNYHQDRVVGDTEVRTHHAYKLSKVFNASICSNGATHVSIYGDDDWYLDDFSYVKYGRNRARAKNKKRRLPLNRFVTGTTLNLYGNVENTSGNYGHWMVDGLGLLYLALREYPLGEIDNFLVPVLRYEFQKDSLLALGIPEQKIIQLPALSCFRFEFLICASAPRGQSSCVIPGWLIDNYRRALLKGNSVTESKRKRLYISRRDAKSRKFINEDDIVHILDNAGFEIIELSNYGFMDKIELFANAEIVVGLSGAGLTNLMFCTKDTRVLEIFPTTFVTYFYASMAGYLGLRYRALIFESDCGLSGFNKYYGNLWLDPKLLEEALEDLS